MRNSRTGAEMTPSSDAWVIGWMVSNGMAAAGNRLSLPAGRAKILFEVCLSSLDLPSGTGSRQCARIKVNSSGTGHCPGGFHGTGAHWPSGSNSVIFSAIFAVWLPRPH